MIFERMWPLAFLLAVPAVVILYLLKPRGKDTRVPSLLLWEKWLRNQESQTFFQKFIHNILMYVQIAIVLLLVLSLTSPYLQRPGGGREPLVFVFDTSASMQHDAGNGRTRIEEAIARAGEIIDSSEGTAVTVIAGDCLGTDLLAVGLTDPAGLKAALSQVVCCDGPGDLPAAQDMVKALYGENGARIKTGEDGEEGASGPVRVIVFTDGEGVEEAAGFSGYPGAQVLVFGEPVGNVANRFLSYAEAGEEADTPGEASPSASRRIRCASSLVNYSDTEASVEISLYEGNRLVAVREATLKAGETAFCFFDEFDWKGEPLRSELGAIRFAGSGAPDSLAGDNVAYAIPEEKEPVEAVLVGEGNIYIEKAYQAVTGESLPRIKEESAEEDALPAVRIYDAGTQESQPGKSRLAFGEERGAAGTARNVLLTVTDCGLTEGLSAFSIGVNETNLYEVPDWGVGFLWAGERCAGYYGEHDGVKAVVVGFDLRESDFPLKAEFPVFLSHALRFLGDGALLAENLYTAGDTVAFHPQAGLDAEKLWAPTEKAGLYTVGPGEGEPYVVRFATESESDGRIEAESTVFGEDETQGGRLVKKRLRNALLALALFLLAVEWGLYRRQARGKNRFYLTVRLIGAALLLLSLCGVGIRIREHVDTTIFLVDLSDSNRQNRMAMEEYLKETLEAMPARNQYGIVTFGRDAQTEQLLTRDTSFAGLLSMPDETATNFETALSRALALFPAGGGGRIVFLTDGKETQGELARMAPALASGQTELLALLYDAERGTDAYVENVELPSYLHQGDAYTMTVTVESNYETDAKLQVLRGTAEEEAYDVRLHRGTNRFQFRRIVTGENVESLEVRVAADGDGCLENDSFFAYSMVEAQPRVLLVCGMDEDGSLYENLLRSISCRFETVSARNAPATLSQMLEYKSILLENVYLSDLPEGFLEQVETYVRDYGGGLVCLGGEDSYALGGYRGSVLETVLPVDMELRGTDEAPVTAMIMVIDHSGSMSADAGGGATSLDLAITAARTAVDQMRPTDYVGVMTFDDTYSWVVEPVLAADKETVKAQIAAIAEGGGTTIRPALKEALAGAAGCEAGIRHVILLTDGQGESTDYREVTNAYNEAGVTLSAVAVGDGADRRLLERLAEKGGGRYYYSDLASDIPKIFAQEVFLSSDTYLQNGEFGLSVYGGEITRGLFADGWPTLYGYVSATPKNAAQVLIASDRDDPVLSVLQYGLGHTVAWNSDVTNQWTAGFAGQDDYAQLWKRILGYSVGNASIDEDSLDIVTAGGTTVLSYEAEGYDEQTYVEAVYTDPQGNTHEAALPAAAPGRFEAKLETGLAGLYHFSVRRLQGEEVKNAVTAAAAVQYSEEYKFGISTAPFTGLIERYGERIEPGTEIWQDKKGGAEERYDLTQWLLALAIVWFVADVALRRFHVRLPEAKLFASYEGKKKEKKEKNLPKTRKKPDQPVQETLDTLALLKKKGQRDRHVF